MTSNTLPLLQHAQQKIACTAGHLATVCTTVTVPAVLVRSIQATHVSVSIHGLCIATGTFLAAALVLVSSLQHVRLDYPKASLAMAICGLAVVSLT